MTSLAPPGAGRSDRIRVVELVFDVVRIDFPSGGDRHSRKVWNHVDELRLGAETVAAWARNGLRIGIASPSAWEPFRAIVDACDAQIRREQMTPMTGMPLAIELGVVLDSESIFSFDRFGRLMGKTFSTGDKLLRVEYVFSPELGNCTDLQITPTLQYDRGVLTWERRGGVTEQVPSVESHTFSDARALVRLQPDEFLVIGLSSQSDNEYLIGPRFLTAGCATGRCETVLCVTPRPVRREATRGGSS